MAFNYPKIFKFVMLLVALGSGAAWMLGGLAMPNDLVDPDSMLSRWSSPGLMVMPALACVAGTVAAFAMAITGFRQTEPVSARVSAPVDKE